MKLQIDLDQMANELDQLAGICDQPGLDASRLAFSDSDFSARLYVKDLLEEAGLEIREDAVGNIFARWEGTYRDLAVVGVGSHLDGMKGNLNWGAVGLLAGLEAIRSLKRSGFQPVRSIELLVFSAHHPGVFDVGNLGSRSLVGDILSEDLEKLRSESGKSLEDIQKRASFPSDLSQTKLPPGYLSSFLQMQFENITQPLGATTAMGLVTAIAAAAVLKVEILSDGGESGSTLMTDRKDALCAASEVILGVEAFARNSGSLNTVGTVSQCRLEPGHLGSIPSKVLLDIEIIDVDADRRDRVVKNIIQGIGQIGRRRDVKYNVRVASMDAPAKASPIALKAVISACTEAGLVFKPVVSRVSYDALLISRIAPITVLTLPCSSGEFLMEHVERGTAAIAGALAKLSLEVPSTPANVVIAE